MPTNKKPTKPHMCPYKIATVILGGIVIILALSLASSIALNIDYKGMRTNSSKSHYYKNNKKDKDYNCVAEPGEMVNVDTCMKDKD
ncbi:hypothetical protein FWF48_03765 [Candidatus Saccharibacteria bacterium]|nr:hypothetical protein [Candidatus Saccharibacteria bacterium]